MVIERIESQIKPGTVIPKPEAKGEFIVKGWGRRRGERALIYKIPNHKNPNKPHQKGITVSEFQKAYNHLIKNGSISRKWFNANLQDCAKEGGCNFTTIGGIFEILGLVDYYRGYYAMKKFKKRNY